MLDDETISELLASTRTRGDYVSALREFGIDVSNERPVVTRRMRFKWRIRNYKDRVSGAWAVLRGNAYIE